MMLYDALCRMVPSLQAKIYTGIVSQSAIGRHIGNGKTYIQTYITGDFCYHMIQATKSYISSTVSVLITDWWENILPEILLTAVSVNIKQQV